MKRTIISLIFALAAIAGFAQTRLQIPFADFQAWAKQIKIAGYPYVVSEQDGSDYSAMLGSGPNKAFQIRLMDINSFSEYKMLAKDAAVYTLNGFKAVYYMHGDITLLTLELPQAQASITFGMNGKVPKATLEDLATKSNFKNLKTSGDATNTPGIKWPEVIPAGLRLNNVQSIESLGSDGTYKDVIEVKAINGPQLVVSLQEIMKKYDGELSFIKAGDVTFMCSVAESLTQIQQDFKPGTLVSFMYYIK